MSPLRLGSLSRGDARDDRGVGGPGGHRGRGGTVNQGVHEVKRFACNLLSCGSSDHAPDSTPKRRPYHHAWYCHGNDTSITGFNSIDARYRCVPLPARFICCGSISKVTVVEDSPKFPWHVCVTYYYYNYRTVQMNSRIYSTYLALCDESTASGRHLESTNIHEVL